MFTLGNDISKALLKKPKVSTTSVLQLYNQKFACLSSGIFTAGKVHISVLTSLSNCQLHFYLCHLCFCLGGHTCALHDG